MSFTQIKVNKKQRKFIVINIKKGIAPVQIADDLGVTRERIRQIFKEEYGVNPQKYLQETFPLKLLTKKEKADTLILRNRYCVYCGKPFINKTENGRRYFCSSRCQNKMVYKYNTFKNSKTCLVCGKIFLPYRVSKYIKRGNLHRYFCSRECTDTFWQYTGQLTRGRKHGWL
jgi:endogenous inhibitor of DNA gyrase (YacG/DUF329 family)